MLRGTYVLPLVVRTCLFYLSLDKIQEKYKPTPTGVGLYLVVKSR